MCSDDSWHGQTRLVLSTPVTMWPFSSSRQTLSDEELQRIRKGCRASRTAHQACAKIYGEGSAACERLEDRVIECLAAQCPSCVEQTEAFRACLQSAGLIRGGILGSECRRQVQDMRRCLARLGGYPAR